MSVPSTKICYHKVLNSVFASQRDVTAEAVAFIVCAVLETCSYANVAYIVKKLCCFKIDPITDQVYVHTLKIINLWHLCSNDKDRIKPFLDMNRSDESWAHQIQLGLLDQRAYYIDLLKNEPLLEVFEVLKPLGNQVLMEAKGLFQKSRLQLGQDHDVSFKIASKDLGYVEFDTWEDAGEIRNCLTKLGPRYSDQTDITPVVIKALRGLDQIDQVKVDRWETKMYESIDVTYLNGEQVNPVGGFITSIAVTSFDTSCLDTQVFDWANAWYQICGLDQRQAFRQAKLLVCELRELKMIKFHDFNQALRGIIRDDLQVGVDYRAIEYHLCLTPSGWSMSYKGIVDFCLSGCDIPCRVEIIKSFDYERFIQTGVIDLKYRILGVDLDRLRDHLSLEEVEQA